MAQRAYVDLERFLRYISEEYGDEIKDRCLEELRRNPEVDPFCVLDKVRVEVHGVAAPSNTGNMKFGW